MDSERGISPDDNFQRDQGIDWLAVVVYGGYLLAIGAIVRSCW